MAPSDVPKVKGICSPHGAKCALFARFGAMRDNPVVWREPGLHAKSQRAIWRSIRATMLILCFQRRRNGLVITERQCLCADDLAGFMALAGDQQHIARMQTRNRLGDGFAAIANLDGPTRPADSSRPGFLSV